MATKRTMGQKGFALNWRRRKSKSTVHNGCFTMRPTQLDAFKLLRNKTHIVLNQPMGSGKSLAMCFISADKMLRDKSLRCVIAVPQTMIGSGFLAANLEYPNGKIVEWRVGHDVCTKDAASKAQAVLDFLAAKPGSLSDRVLLCTHATLVTAYKRLKDAGRLRLLKNLLVWIDEAHHIMNGEVEGKKDEVVSNGIGDLVRYLMDKKSVQIGLATATFARGDRFAIIPDVDRFTWYKLPYDKYLESMEHLESFSYDFMLYRRNHVDAVEALFKQNKHAKSIIYIPHPKSNNSTGDKLKEADDIIRRVAKVHGARAVKQPNGTVLLKRKRGRPLVVINLVDEDQRDEKKAFIASVKSHDDLDVIVALGMFKEGANWIWAERSIIIGARGSLTDQVQMIGRLFRDAPGKRHVEVFQLLPFSVDQHDAGFTDRLNGYMTAVCASMILENVLNPMRVRKGEGIEKCEPTDALADEVPDLSEQQSLLEEVLDKLVEICARCKGKRQIEAEYRKSVAKIIKAHGVRKVEHVLTQIWNTFTRKSLRVQGCDVSHIDFQVLHETNAPAGFLTKYTSACGLGTFEKLRRALSVHKTVDEYVSEANALIAEHGILPNAGWLLDHGFAGLCNTMYKYPDAFADINQLTLQKSRQDHLTDAMRLVSEHGILPNYQWLVDNGFASLPHMMHKYPELFSGIQQKKLKKTDDEHVADAERLAKKHNGLPPSAWLKRNGFCGLVACLIKRPDLFIGISRQWMVKTIDEHLADASLLVKEYGQLPNQAWLHKNGFGALAQVLLKHPDDFAGIKQKRLRKSVDEHIADARRLAKEHGAIPNPRWLTRNGFDGLYQAMTKYPDAFVHTPKKTCIKTIDDHVNDAKHLVKEHGAIPNPHWLTRNGFGGLYSAMGKHPDSFAEFPKLMRSARSPEEWSEVGRALSVDGVLPPNKWLNGNGYTGLVSAMQKSPEIFRWVKRRPTGRRKAS